MECTALFAICDVCEGVFLVLWSSSVEWIVVVAMAQLD
jgi:hypothetical protein